MCKLKSIRRAMEYWGNPEDGMDVVPSEFDIHSFSIKRSGQQTILNWILAHYAQHTIIYRNVRLFGSRFVARYESIGRKNSHLKLECRILCFEDQPKDLGTDNDFRTLCEKMPVPHLRLLVLRDPFNTFASRLQAHRSLFPVYRPVWTNVLNVDEWKWLAYEFLGETNYFGECVKVNYNRWCKDQDYRRQISKYFGDFTDKNFVKLSEAGSSFDQMDFVGRANQMRLTERWKRVRSDEEYIEKVMQDDELHDLSKRIFEFTPVIKQFL